MTTNNSIQKNTKAQKEQKIQVDKNLTLLFKDGKTIRIWKGMEVGPDNHLRPRVGKTKKDKISGAANRNASNKAARAAWDNSGTRRTQATFPYQHCNGKRNRSVITGKGNEQIRLTYKAAGK